MKPLTGLLGGVALACWMAAPALASAGDSPNAVDDYVERENKVIHIDVLANDTAAGATLDSSTLQIATGPAYGEAIVIATGTPRIKYTAFATNATVDTFKYRICDTEGSCATATVTINFVDAVVATTSTTTSTTSTSTPTTTTTSTEDEAAAPLAPQAPEPSTPPVSDPPTDTTPKVHALAETTLGSHDMLTAGTAIGEARGIQLGEDVAYLGRSGLDTLTLVATPALMVSGIVGFLMIGLPQNGFGSALGFLTAYKSRRKNKTESGTTMVTPN